MLKAALGNSRKRPTSAACGRCLAGLVLVVAVLAIGCVDDQSGGSRLEPPEGAGPAASADSDEGNAVDLSGSEPSRAFSQLVSVEDRIFLFEAQEELIGRCMDDRGFRYVPNKVDLEVAPMGRSWDDIRVHPLQSREQAEQEGYGGPSRFVRKTEGHTEFSDSAEGVSPFYDPNREHYLQLSEADQEAWHAALIGTGSEVAEAEIGDRELQDEQSVARGEIPEGHVGLWMNTDGCVGVAEAAIYGDLGDFMRLSFIAGDALRNEVWARVEASVALVDAEAAWQECMSQHGHDFGDIREDARDAVQQAYDTEPLEVAMARESEIAVQDATCATESGLFDVIDSELARIAGEVIAEHEVEILGYQEMMAKAVDTAKALLAEG